MAGGPHPALWSYSNGDPPRFPDSGDESDDVEAAQPGNKRRKLQQRPAPQVITLDDDTDLDEASDADVEEGEARRGVALEGLSQDSLRLSPMPAPLPRPAQLDEATQRLLERNRRALDALQKAAQEEPIDLISSSDEEAPPSPAPQSPTEEEQKVQLVVQCKDHKKTMQMSTSKPLQRLFDAWKKFAEEEGWIEADTKLRFVFDGDPLSGEETPAELSLEAEDVIEVMW